jgi:hypothetical protein
MEVTGTDAIIKIVDVWTVRDRKVTSIWVAYFELRRCSTNSASPTSSPADGRRSFEPASAQKTEPRTFQMFNHTQQTAPTLFLGG